MQVEITTLKRRGWGLFRPRRFSLQVPHNWAEVTPLARRQRWWRWLMTLPRPAAVRAMIRDILPRWVRKRISDLDFAGLTLLLDWVQAENDCDQIPLESFQHKGIEFHFPASKGENVSCIEYALADDYYKAFTAGEQDALMNLVATIWREREADEKLALCRDDKRVPLYSKAEVAKRAEILNSAPPEMLLQALLYFGGLKAYIYRVYGKWLFEQDDEDDVDEEDNQEEANAAPTGGPDFGWWGTFQSIAETGVFGNKEQVHQESIHEVCIFLVRKRAESERQQPTDHTVKPTEDED